MRKISWFGLVVACLLASVRLSAQEERNWGIIASSLKGLEYSVKAGVNIGGTSPLPLPREIRSIDGYRPTLCISLEGDVKKWFGERHHWGMLVGLRLENKGMETKATVKSYKMEIIGNGGERLSGYWTGGVQTKVKNSFFSIPVLALYRLNNRVEFSAGPYVSFLTNGDFYGYVYDGYLREIDPTGVKVEFAGENRATYDFSSEQRKVHWGLQAGAEWKAFKHLIVFGDLTWGVNDLFVKNFQTISFAMYPIYLNAGFGYFF